MHMANRQRKINNRIKVMKMVKCNKVGEEYSTKQNNEVIYIFFLYYIHAVYSSGKSSLNKETSVCLAVSQSLLGISYLSAWYRVVSHGRRSLYQDIGGLLLGLLQLFVSKAYSAHAVARMSGHLRRYL